ncbi:MAG TPA: GNAT family N-acetyltransferase [Acidimicrobiales bacterium]|nr:GNAT family N-acetyltransferase [Acidimicrobiales bacterium]
MTIVAANEASWDDVAAVVQPARCHGGHCFCQRFKVGVRDWGSVSDEERAWLLREQTDCGNAGSATTSGLLAYRDGEPVGWCNVEPRSAFPGLRGSRVVWAGRNEDTSADDVWAVTCFVVRVGHRRSRITYALAEAARDHAFAQGARAVEGYPMVTTPGHDVTWGELHVGSHKVFAAAGFVEVTRPSVRRAVMRIDR